MTSRTAAAAARAVSSSNWPPEDDARIGGDPGPPKAFATAALMASTTCSNVVEPCGKATVTVKAPSPRSERVSPAPNDTGKLAPAAWMRFGRAARK